MTRVKPPRLGLASCLVGLAVLLGAAAASAVCPCSTSPGFDNFCDHPPSTSGCAMTYPGGYCDPNGDASYSDGDWVRGYNEYHATYPSGCVVTTTCPCNSSAGFDNFCDHPPSTPGCAMTYPGGYCDPNGDASYSDGDWVRGYNEYLSAYPSGCSSPPPPPPPSGCRCTGGSDYWGNPVDPDVTYCGYRVCGGDNQYYECTSSGWRSIGGSPCAGTSTCRCTGGSDYWGNPVDPDVTFCGYRVCGGDNQYYECGTGGWQAVGGSPCATVTTCRCANGTDYWNVPVDPDATYCGFRVCGRDDQYYECRTTGWQAIGGAPCHTDSPGLDCFGLAVNANGAPIGAPAPAELSQLGVRWVRTIVYTGKHDVARRLGQALEDEGIQLLVVFNAESFEDTRCNSSPADLPGVCNWTDYIDHYTDALRTFVQQYDDVVDAYQVWNEPDITGVDWPEYADMVEVAFNKLRPVTDDPILLSGPAGGPWETYLERLLARLGNAGNPYDGLGFHPYEKSIPGALQAYSGRQTMEEALDIAFELQSEPRRPLWLTELGLPLADVDLGHLTPEEAQAQYVSEAYRLFEQLGPERIAHAFWFAWSDYVQQLDGGGQMGLVDTQLAPRLSWQAYRHCATATCRDYYQLPAPPAGASQCPCVLYDDIDNLCLYPLIGLCYDLQQPACDADEDGMLDSPPDWTGGFYAYQALCG